MGVIEGSKIGSKFAARMGVIEGSKIGSIMEELHIKTSRSFKELECWQKAHEFVKKVYQITKQFPDDERYGLTSQFRRAAISIAANICEGYRKMSNADKLRFMNIAQGSLEECRYYNILSLDIEYIDFETYNKLEYLLNGTSWKLNGYADAIKQNK